MANLQGVIEDVSWAKRDVLWWIDRLVGIFPDLDCVPIKALIAEGDELSAASKMRAAEAKYQASKEAGLEASKAAFMVEMCGIAEPIFQRIAEVDALYPLYGVEEDFGGKLRSVLQGVEITHPVPLLELHDVMRGQALFIDQSIEKKLQDFRHLGITPRSRKGLGGKRGREKKIATRTRGPGRYARSR